MFGRNKQSVLLVTTCTCLGKACIVTLCGGAAPCGAPVRARNAKHAVPPSAFG